VGELLYWYSEQGNARGCSPPRPLLAVSNVTAHPSTASVPITVLLYNDPLLRGFNVPNKGLNKKLRLLERSCVTLHYFAKSLEVKFPMLHTYIHTYITNCIARCVDSTEYMSNQRRWRQSLGGQLLASKVISFQVAIKAVQ